MPFLLCSVPEMVLPMELSEKGCMAQPLINYVHVALLQPDKLSGLVWSTTMHCACPFAKTSLHFLQQQSLKSGAWKAKKCSFLCVYICVNYLNYYLN